MEEASEILIDDKNAELLTNNKYKKPMEFFILNLSEELSLSLLLPQIWILFTFVY